MVRITRRDFLKYCSIAAGALGLSASTLMKVERVLANSAAPTVVWLSGSACTGCTMSLLNSVFYTTVDDLLLNRINLAYLDTAMAAAGAYDDTGHMYGGCNALKAAQDIYNGTGNFVLVVEGAIPTGTPPGGAPGDYCRIGNLTGTGAESVWENVRLFATHANCLAVLSVGTCSSFGGIPGANGNVTGAKGVAFSGTTPGGAIVSNAGSVSYIKVTNGGSGYSRTTPPLVSIAAPPTGGTQATAKASVGVALTTGAVTIVNGGTNYTTSSAVSFSGGGGAGAIATITSVDVNGAITGMTISNGGSGYVDVPNVYIGSGQGGVVTPTLQATGSVYGIAVEDPGSGYTSIPAVTLPSGGATAKATLSTGAVKNRSGKLAPKVINISGCPPHPDWIVGTIAHILDTNISSLPSVNNNYQPVDYGYKEYQCNAGPCPWRFNNNPARDGIANHNTRYPDDGGNSKNLGKNKWTRSSDFGCIGILGCKGRKTKADCSRRRWNADAAETYGVNWCVGSRAGCHGCTEPSFPDKVGKFFTFA